MASAVPLVIVLSGCGHGERPPEQYPSTEGGRHLCVAPEAAHGPVTSLAVAGGDGGQGDVEVPPTRVVRGVVADGDDLVVLTTHTTCGAACPAELAWHRSVDGRRAVVLRHDLAIDLADPVAVTRADVDRDGRADLLITYRHDTTAARLAIADDRVGLRLDVAAAPGCALIAVDADCDGRGDLILACAGRRDVFLATEDGRFEPWDDPSLWAAR